MELVPSIPVLSRLRILQDSEASFSGPGSAGGGMSEAQLGRLPPMYRDQGRSRVSRVQDILMFLQLPQMDVGEYRVRSRALDSMS